MNFTHGMATSLQEIKSRVLEKTFKIDEIDEQQQPPMVREGKPDLQRSAARAPITALGTLRSGGRRGTQHGKKDDEKANTGYGFRNFTGVLARLRLSSPYLDGEILFEAPGGLAGITMN